MAIQGTQVPMYTTTLFFFGYFLNFFLNFYEKKKGKIEK